MAPPTVTADERTADTELLRRIRRRKQEVPLRKFPPLAYRRRRRRSRSVI